MGTLESSRRRARCSRRSKSRGAGITRSSTCSTDYRSSRRPKPARCAIPDAETRQEAEEQRDGVIARFDTAYPDEGQDSTRRRGAQGHLLWLSGRAVDAPAHDYSCRVTRRGRAPANTAATRVKKVANTTALIWRVLFVAERSCRRLDHPQLLAEVAEGPSTSMEFASLRRSTPAIKKPPPAAWRGRNP